MLAQGNVMEIISNEVFSSVGFERMSPIEFGLH